MGCSTECYQQANEDQIDKPPGCHGKAIHYSGMVAGTGGALGRSSSGIASRPGRPHHPGHGVSVRGSRGVLHRCNSRSRRSSHPRLVWDSQSDVWRHPAGAGTRGAQHAPAIDLGIPSLCHTDHQLPDLSSRAALLDGAEPRQDTPLCADRDHRDSDNRRRRRLFNDLYPIVVQIDALQQSDVDPGVLGPSGTRTRNRYPSTVQEIQGSAQQCFLNRHIGLRRCSPLHVPRQLSPSP